MAEQSLAKKRKLTNMRAAQTASVVDDVRINFLTPLLPPACLMGELAKTSRARAPPPPSRHAARAPPRSHDASHVAMLRHLDQLTRPSPCIVSSSPL